MTMLALGASEIENDDERWTYLVELESRVIPASEFVPIMAHNGEHAWEKARALALERGQRLIRLWTEVGE